MRKVKGSCVCNKVQFTVKDEFMYAGYCHCSKCRKASGSAGAAIGGLRKENLTINKGEDFIKRFNRSKDSITCFCGVCGSPLFGEKLTTGLVHVRYGALDESPSLLPQAHMHVSSKAEWYEITDTLPRFNEFPPV